MQISQISGGFRKLKLSISQVAKLSCNLLALCPSAIPFPFPFRKLQKFHKWNSTTCEIVGCLISSVSSLHPRLVLAKGYEAPKLSFFMNLSFNLLFHYYTKISLILGLLW